MSDSLMRDPLSRFLAQADRQPEAPALITSTHHHTYGALAHRVRQYAGRFRELQAERVLIHLPKGLEAYAAIVGAGLSGCVYTPTLYEIPLEKLDRILKKLRPSAIVTDHPGAAALAREVDAIVVSPGDVDGAVPMAGLGTRHPLAYIMFTSGSTGVPKGVEVLRSGVHRYLDWVRDQLRLTSLDRMSQYPSLGFDISVTDIYGALSAGAALCVPTTPAELLSPGDFIHRMRISVLNCVPSLISLLMQSGDAGRQGLGSLRLVNLCGEPVYATQLEFLFSAVPDLVVNNTYGPTEATVAVTCQRLIQSNYLEHCQTTASIGSPIPGTSLRLETAADDATEGELLIYGEQLAKGYLDDPGETEKSFGIDLNGDRRYRTGDIFFRRREQLFFRQRKDFQVKIRGHRIELDEIDVAFHRLGFQTVLTVDVPDRLGHTVLACLVELEQPRLDDEAALRRALAAQLEPYARPKIIVPVKTIPRNDSGKLDRKAARDVAQKYL